MFDLRTTGDIRASDGNPISNGSGGHREAQQVSMPEMVKISPNPKVNNQGTVPPLSRIGSSSYRFSPYGSNKGCGDGISSFPSVGESTVLDTQMDGLKPPSSPANPQVSDKDSGMYSPRKDSNDIQSIIWDANNGHYKIAGRTQGSGTIPPLSRIGSSSYRFSPYGSNKGCGALRGKGKGVNRKEKVQNKYSPMLSELRVNEFVHETTVIGDRRKGRELPATIGLNTTSDGSTRDGISSFPSVGESTVLDTQMDGLKPPSSPANPQVSDKDSGMCSPRKDSNDIQSIIWDANNGHYKIAGRTQGSVSGIQDCDMNTQTDTH
ncbi:hypothetical protein L1987_08917 [Smallanthus sonchifolius]|uniref:Uncharacterized protein n=1 Tax=Smallanthus sonchifolius TaxID=185202 RepID=A0ACB9JNN6_9ASTR|nr:hypothetical protein L1987_08917 [Smallanthus sonchifolius]